MQVQEKVCPECATTYRAEALRCADCDVELVDAASFGGIRREAAPQIDFEALECVRAADAPWAEGFHAALVEAGVTGHIAAVEDGSGQIRVGVFVRPEDRERALELDHEFSLRHLGVDPEHLQAGHCGICNAPLADAGQDLCDACRADLEPDQEPEPQRMVVGADGVPRQAAAGEGESGGLGANVMLLIGGGLIALAALFWFR